MIIHEKLAHLSSKQIIQLMDEYYAGVRVKKLIEDYKVNCRPNDLHKYFPPIVLDKNVQFVVKIFLIRDFLRLRLKIKAIHTEK